MMQKLLQQLLTYEQGLMDPPMMQMGQWTHPLRARTMLHPCTANDRAGLYLTASSAFSNTLALFSRAGGMLAEHQAP
jgi:hypothetical protein